ncbi:MAG: hypothetical protein J7485_10125 [Sphingobium sp.]|nr:hypothetical protein [Sphingobium sp.]
MSNSDSVRFRLLRDSADPPSPDGSAVRFGLQDSKDNIQPPVKRADSTLVFEFELKVKEGPDPERPVFTGPFASGPRDERFVYLAWQRLNEQGYVNRVKIRLTDIGWPLVREAQASGRPLEYDASGRGTGGGRVAVEWKLGEA